jgi:hypothetical protein
MRTALKLGVEILPAFRCGVMIKDILAGCLMPVVKSVTGGEHPLSRIESSRQPHHHNPSARQIVPIQPILRLSQE